MRSIRFLSSVYQSNLSKKAPKRLKYLKEKIGLKYESSILYFGVGLELIRKDGRIQIKNIAQAHNKKSERTAIVKMIKVPIILLMSFITITLCSIELNTVPLLPNPEDSSFHSLGMDQLLEKVIEAQPEVLHKLLKNYLKSEVIKCEE